MKPEYADITSRIKEKPTWYDSFGTPRYGKFHPEMIPNNYATSTILLKIECRCCHERFNVQLDDDRFPEFVEKFENGGLYERTDLVYVFDYGEPPFHNCDANLAFSSNPMKILEFWDRPKSEWKRIKDYEIAINERE